MEACETLMSLKPKTAYEKLLWERLKTKTLTEQLKQSEILRGELGSELSELKYHMKRDNKDVYILKCREHNKQTKLKDQKIQKLKEENEKLLCLVAKYNLKKLKDEEAKHSE